MAEQSLSAWLGEWWSNIPWGWLTLIAAAFFLGQIIADWFNQNSWLRQKWEHSRRLFDVEITTPSLQQEQRIEVVAELTAICDMPNSTALLHVYDVLGNRNKKTNTLTVFSGETMHRDQSRKVRIASVPVQSPPTKDSGGAYWLENAAPLLEGAENIIEIEIRSGNKSQRHSIFIKMMQRDAGTKGRFFVIDEDHKAIDIGVSNGAR